MTELIRIEPSRIGGETIQTCNARDLHAFLKVKARFNDWIRNRVEDFGFQENQDFITLTRLLVSGGKRKDYYLSLDMAKELAMVERNAKGKEARLYFIDCERIAKSKTAVPALPSYPEALRQLADAIDRNGVLESQKLALEHQARENAPKVAFAEDVVASGKEVTITVAAKILGMPPQKFRDWLRKNGFLYANANHAMQTSIRRGLMVVRFASFNHSDGTAGTSSTPHITGAGLFYFYQRLLAEELIDRNPNLELVA
jgi:anti-repressor protein